MAYTVSETDRFVEIRFSGATSTDELIQLVGEMVQGNPIPYPASCLVDLSDLEFTDIGYDAVTRILDYRESLLRPDAGTRIAIVATEPHIFGMARMVELRTSGHARTARAFQSREEAKAWLIEDQTSPA